MAGFHATYYTVNNFNDFSAGVSYYREIKFRDLGGTAPSGGSVRIRVKYTDPYGSSRTYSIRETHLKNDIPNFYSSSYSLHLQYSFLDVPALTVNADPSNHQALSLFRGI